MGFTLVELSIVIVIIGLVVAVVTAGNTLVTQAKIRSTISDINKLKIAVTTFQLQYDVLPGDISNAQSYWGAGNTTNGDGNRVLTGNECYKAWQHLALSGVISGSYVGNTGTGTRRSNEVFYSSLAKIWIENLTDSNVLIGSGVTKSNHNLSLLLSNPKADSQDISPNLTVANTKAIDTKIDDGVANKGLFRAVDGIGGVAGCSSAWSPGGLGVDYVTANLTTTDLKCVEMVILKW